MSSILRGFESARIPKPYQINVKYDLTFAKNAVTALYPAMMRERVIALAVTRKHLMFAERRKQQRYSINRVARIVTVHGAAPRDCTITDISESGARLFVDMACIPDDFRLVINGGTTESRQCRVVWRLGGEMGVAFVADESEEQHKNLIAELRLQARTLFQ